MKVKAKCSWFDRSGLHTKNDIVEIDDKAFDPILMEKLPEEAKKVEAPKKTTKKKG